MRIGIEGIDKILSDITKFPAEKKEERKMRFAAQILAWKWYYSEAVKKQNKYLVYLAIQKLILFSSRIVLNVNEMLYPYHKWMLEEVKKTPKKPEGFISGIYEMLNFNVFDNGTVEKVNEFCSGVLSFTDVDEKLFFWPNQFLKDSEINWMDREPPVDDL